MTFAGLSKRALAQFVQLVPLLQSTAAVWKKAQTAPAINNS